MRDHVKVIIENEQIRVVFEDTAFYWRFVENGTVNQRAQSFASGTYAQNKTKIESLMSKQLLKEMSNYGR
ncbi:HK97-gp10 family putative phage morphogenesis protein [Brochothrix campestris]|nr:HK97-gp10 family putative phage morphogenesis protein [Brochothrix campestris]